MSQHCDSRGCWERVMRTAIPQRVERPLDYRDAAEIARIVEERWLTGAW